VLDKTLKRNRAVRLFFDDSPDALQLSLPPGRELRRQQPAGLPRPWHLRQRHPLHRPARQRPGLRYRNIHLGEAYFVENHAGVVDTLYRIFRLTNAQICSATAIGDPRWREGGGENPQQRDKKREVLHCVYRARTTCPARMDGPGAFEFLGHIDVQTQTAARVGLRLLPVRGRALHAGSGETYGRGPAQWVLPAIKGLNEQKKTVLKQGHRASSIRCCSRTTTATSAASACAPAR
jgi:hypothetical protein